MPTVFHVGSFRVLILFPPREHSPAHVHVVNADGLVVIRLATNQRLQRTVRVDGMEKADVRRAERIVRDNNALLLEAWRRIHGSNL